MIQALQAIFLLEDRDDYDKAFELYNKFYLANKGDYEAWKYFYFFLWTAIEYAPDDFRERTNLRHFLGGLYEEGKKHFSDLADFNFIAGWTVLVFPYGDGDFYAMEDDSRQMLLKATILEPASKVYRLAYLATVSIPGDEKYKEAEIDALPELLITFAGNGYVNKYFKRLLYRFKKSPKH